MIHPDWARHRATNAYRVARGLYNWDRIAKMTVETYEATMRAAAENEWAYWGTRKGRHLTALGNGAGPTVAAATVGRQIYGNGRTEEDAASATGRRDPRMER